MDLRAFVSIKGSDSHFPFPFLHVERAMQRVLRALRWRRGLAAGLALAQRCRRSLAAYLALRWRRGLAAGLALAQRCRRSLAAYLALAQRWRRRLTACLYLTALKIII
jgi:hypothetical protein